MGILARHFFGSLAAFIVLDFLWLNFVMSSFNARQLAGIGRLNNGKFEILYGPAACAYILMAASVAFFVLPRVGSDGSVLSSWLLGAFMGLIVYGIFDMTNMAVLKDYPWPFALADMAWGTFVYGVVTALMFSVSKHWF